MSLEREWIRGAGPLAVLTLLDEREMYGYELCEALEERSGSLLGMGQSTVYTLLYALEARGFVRTRRRTAPTGRARKYYRLTSAGRERLRDQQGQWARLVRALTRLGVPAEGLDETLREGAQP